MLTCLFGGDGARGCGLPPRHVRRQPGLAEEYGTHDRAYAGAVEATYPGMGLPFNQPETELERETVYETSLGAGVYRSAAGSFL